jgi:hypothetical protein
MQAQTKSYEMKHRIPNHPHEYWTLKLILNGEVVRVHTSENRRYIEQLRDQWMQHTSEV